MTVMSHLYQQTLTYDDVITLPSNHVATCSNNPFVNLIYHTFFLLIVVHYINFPKARTDQTTLQYS